MEPDHHPRGKSSDDTDIVRARFLQLVRDERIVLLVEFESQDPAFAVPMIIRWALADVPGGTEVSVSCENAPEAIRAEDHEAGFRSTLENLAAFAEGDAPASGKNINGRLNA
jgi:uncharacterized protein YndB with AHSA1/START domain